MDDVRKLGDRVDEVVARVLGHEVPQPGAPIDWARVNADAMDEWRREKVAVLLRSLDPMYHDAQPRHELSHKWLAAYRAGTFVNLAIFGPTGVGKTWEEAGIAAELLTSMVPALMVRVPEMVAKLHPVHGDPLDIGQFQSAPVLLLDDLGSEPAKDWVAEILFRLTDHRHRKLLPTVVTSNLSLAALEERYNDRVLRRLFQHAAKLTIRELPPGLPEARFGVQL